MEIINLNLKNPNILQMLQKRNEVKNLRANLLQNQNNHQLQTPQRQIISYDIVANRVDIQTLKTQETLKLLYELLQLPDDFEKMLEQTKKQIPSDDLNEKTIDLFAFMNFFNQNVKKANKKLMDLISYYKENQVGKNETLNELITIIKALSSSVEKIENNQNAFVRNIILLYLPWLPLGSANDFRLGFNNEESEDSSKSDETITILVSTLNFGNVKVVLTKDQSEKIFIFFSCSEKFPKKQVLKQISSEAMISNLNIDVDFETKKQNSANNLQSFDVNACTKVSLKMLSLAYSIIKTIIEIDKNFKI